MARIHVGGAGGAPANNVIRSLRESHPGDHLIGASSSASDLLLAEVNERYPVPLARTPAYRPAILDLVSRTRPDLIVLTHDFEVEAVSALRDELDALGVRTFLPDHDAVVRCVDKHASYVAWQAAGLTVPATILVDDEASLRRAFAEFGPRVWLRATQGGGGTGALPTDSFEFARLWVDRFNGWGRFTAAAMLTPSSVTWQSIWYEGELVVAQGRRRRAWNFGDRTLSGVTGVTGVAETSADPAVDSVAMSAIAAIDPRPHGIYGVDMAYDDAGRPNPTEINIGRFFTTIYFFTRAGLNMPAIYRDLALEGRKPVLDRRLNPLPDGLVWVRGMDVDPVLTTVDGLRSLEATRWAG